MKRFNPLKMCTLKKAALIASSGFFGLSLTSFVFADDANQCEVAIIGGGPGGTHTAFKLIQQNLTDGKVCLFEKKDRLGGRVGNNYKIGATQGQFATSNTYDPSKPFTLNGDELGKTGTGGYRMYDNQYTFVLGKELAALAPGKLTLMPQRSFNRLLSVQNRKFNSDFTKNQYFTYDNGGVASEFKPLYNVDKIVADPASFDNDVMWGIQLCGPQVVLDAQGNPRYDLMDGRPGWGGKRVDIRNMSSLDYLQWVTANIIAPGKPEAAQRQIAQYFLDTYRFRGDYSTNLNPVSFPSFKYNPNDPDGNDAASYLNFTAVDYASGTTYYPIPSFQSYFDIMEKVIRDTEINGVKKGKIYLNEAVTDVNADSSGGYIVKTSQGKTINAKIVIIATAQNDVTKIRGNVIDAITKKGATLLGKTYENNSSYFASPRATNALTITQQYGDDSSTPGSGWWNASDRNNLQKILYPTNEKLLGSNVPGSSDKVLRSVNNRFIEGVTFSAINNCQGLGNGIVLDSGYSCATNAGVSQLMYNGVKVSFSNNTNELPLSDYHDFINVSRGVYADGQAGFRDWKNLYIAGGDKAVTAQLNLSMRFMYPRVFQGEGQEPTPKQIRVTNPLTGEVGDGLSQVTLHFPAWYNLGKGSGGNKITNQSLFNWSLNPLGKEKVYLIGDSWRNDESAWSDAAYKGSIYVLNKVFKANIDPVEPKIIGCDAGSLVFP